MRLSILLLLLVKRSEQGVSFHEGSMDQGVVLSCVNRIVKRHFDREHQVTILTVGSKDYVKGMEARVRTLGDVSNLDKISQLTETRQGVVFLDGDFPRDKNLLQSLGAFDPRSRFLIVSTIGDNGSLSRTEDHLINVVRLLHRNRISAVAMAVRSGDRDAMDLYGYTKTAHGNCGSPEVVDFGKCNSEQSLSLLFPRVVNYHGCPLRLASFDWLPYTQFVQRNGRMESIGIESDLVNVIVERLNASKSYIVAAPSEIRVLVGNHNADIGYGKLTLYDQNEYLYTNSDGFVHGLVIIPKYSGDRSEMNNLTPLESTVWIGIILVLIFVIFVRSFFPVFKVISLLETMAIFLGLSVRARPKRLSQRGYLMSLILFGYVISQSYLANLTTVFTKAGDQDVIGSIEELDKSTIPFGGALSTAKFFEKKYPRLYKDYKAMNLSEFKKNLLNLKDGMPGSLATYVEESKYVEYNKWRYIVVVPEIIVSYSTAMILPNSTSILSTCDWAITAIFESGIMDHWACLLNKQKFEADDLMAEQTDDDGRMGLEQFLIIFRSLGMALALSTTVFIIELVVAFLRRRKH